MWNMHAPLISEVMVEGVLGQSNDQYTEQHSRDIHQLLTDNLTDIQRRNEAMLFRKLPPHTSTELGSAVSDVKVTFGPHLV